MATKCPQGAACATGSTFDQTDTVKPSPMGNFGKAIHGSQDVAYDSPA